MRVLILGRRRAVVPENSIRRDSRGEAESALFKSRRRLEVENLFLRHQLNIRPR